MVDAIRAAAVEHKRSQSEELYARLAGWKVYPTASTREALATIGITPMTSPASVEELLRRPNVRYSQLQQVLDLPDVPDFVSEQVELKAHYGGYIARQQREAERVRKMENRRIPPDFDYSTVKGLRNEARQVMQRFRPATLGQAGRLAGINPSDVSILMFTLERYGRGKTATPPQDGEHSTQQPVDTLS
jgi:tRNA uridine 5-carboxymethylaminomethyl modification enzyme